MWEKVEEALDTLVAEGTLEPVDYSNWVAPIIAVMRSDHNSMRIRGDFQTTINPESKLNHYLIPKTEDLFSMFRRGKFFTKLDLSQAYQLLNLEELSRKYVVISIHKAYTHICCTVYTSFVPGMFQKAMKQCILHVTMYIDDILIRVWASGYSGGNSLTVGQSFSEKLPLWRQMVARYCCFGPIS